MRVGNTVSKKKRAHSKKLLFESMEKKNSYLMNKVVLEETDLYYFVKDFFREYLLINKELSFEEIKQEVEKIHISEKVKDQLLLFLEKISDVEYVDNFFDEKNIKKHIVEFYKLVKKIANEEKESIGFFGSLFKSSNKENLEEATNIVESDVSIETEPVIALNEEYEEGLEEKGKENMNLGNEVEVMADYKEQEEGSELGGEDHFDVGVSDEIEIFDESESYDEDDVKSLLSKADDTNNRDELLTLYNKINSLYDEKDIDEKTKLYPKLLNLYERVTSSNDEDKGKKLISEEKIFDKSNDFKRQESDLVNEIVEIPEIDDFQKEDKFKNSFEEDILEEDVFYLFDEADKADGKDELLVLYDKINSLYDEKSEAEKEDIYPRLLELYERIQKLPEKKIDEVKKASIKKSSKKKNKNKINEAQKVLNKEEIKNEPKIKPKRKVVSEKKKVVSSKPKRKVVSEKKKVVSSKPKSKQSKSKKTVKKNSKNNKNKKKK